MKLQSIFIIIILLAGVIGVNYYSSEPYEMVGQGFSFDAPSLAYPTKAGETNTWIVTGEFSGYGQSFEGSSFSESIDLSYEGSRAEYDFSVSGKISDQKGLYLINNNNPDQITKFRIETKNAIITENWFSWDIEEPDACSSGAYQNYDFGGFTSVFPWADKKVVLRVCVYEDNVGTKATINTIPIIKPTIELNVISNGKAKVIKLDSTGVESLGNNLGSVEWTNSPVLGESLGAVGVGNNYIAIYKGIENKDEISSSNNDWNVAWKSDFDTNWIQARSNVVTTLGSFNTFSYTGSDCAKDKGIEDLDEISECYENYFNTIVNPSNEFADKLINSDLKIIIFDDEHITSHDKSNGGFWVDLSDIYVASPKLRFRISSDWVGIIYPNGEPSVISAETIPEKFRSGEPVRVKVYTKNIGSGTGNFKIQDLSISNNDLSDYYETFSKSIPSGKSDYVTVVLTTTGESSSTGTITGKVVDTGSLKSSNFKTNYIMENPAQCIVGDVYWTDGNVIQICNSDAELIDYKECTNGVIANDDNEWICSDGKENEGGNGEGGGGDEEIVCEEGDMICQLEGLGNILWIIGFGSLTALFMIINKMRSRTKKYTKDNLKSSALISIMILSVYWLYLQYLLIINTLGFMIWIAVLLTMIILWVSTPYLMPLIKIMKIGNKQSFGIIGIIILMLIISIMMSLKGVACDTFLSVLFSECNISTWDLILGR